MYIGLTISFQDLIRVFKNVSLMCFTVWCQYMTGYEDIRPNIYVDIPSISVYLPGLPGKFDQLRERTLEQNLLHILNVFTHSWNSLQVNIYS